MASTSDSSRYSNKLVEEFCAVTGADEVIAKQMLEACNGNLEMAVNMHVDSDWASSSTDFPSSSSASEPPPQSASKDEIIVDEMDDVRPPIPPVREVLVERSSYSYAYNSRRRLPRSVFDGFRDLQAETKLQEAQLLHGLDSQAYKKRKTLEDLFRPPLDLIHRGSFQSARDEGQATNRWLMVNIQNGQEFACQVLNRDVWSNPAVKSIVTEHFVFWQVYHDSEEGQRYILFYKVLEFPYVAILDPRTGENLVVWNKLDSLTFCDVVTEFLTEHPSPDGSSVNPPKKKLKPESIYEESEESQIKAAIEASLRENSLPKNSNQELVSDNEDDVSDLETFDSDTESSSHVGTLSTNENSNSSTSRQDWKNKDGKTSSERSSDAWKEFLGREEDEKSEILLRFPDGSKQLMSFPCTSQLQALVLFASAHGFEDDAYELITNFPRRNVSSLNRSSTLKEVGLFPKETVFIQLRNS